MIKKGLFIVVEGLEGAGKSTALNTIEQLLDKHSREWIVAREPGGTSIGEIVRTIVKDPNAVQPLDPRVELLLFYAARTQLIETVIRPALASGISVLLDRFELSTFAYQGGGRALDEAMIQQLSRFCVVDMVPDVTVFLDISVEQGLKRVAKRGEMDRIEQESQQFFRTVHEAYHKHLKNQSNVMMIDASQPLRQVQQTICYELEPYIVSSC